MKAQFNQATAVLLLSAVAGLFSGGCAGTPIRNGTDEYIDDSAITAKVKAALLGDDSVKTFDIHVETFKGVVQLSGFVDTSTERLSAANDASSVNGVRRIKNDITLK